LAKILSHHFLKRRAKMNTLNENPKQNKPDENDEKKAKINRAIYITAVILLISIAVIAGITSAANRAKKEPSETKPPQSTPEATLPDETPNASSPNESESKPSEDEDTSASSKLPTFVLPANGSLSVGHDPELQVFSPTMQDYRVHLGIDINTEVGAAVYAAADGKIEKIWQDPMMGTCLAVSHSGGAVSYYKNLSETAPEGISVGSTVKAGQLIGSVGESAMVESSQEPHLHFEITVAGIQEDPTKLFDKDVLAKLEEDDSFEG
jgi:murein DD-endopeptidase MepM/ murein hydrolase activator NlpD